MPVTYRMSNAPNSHTLEQAARMGMNWAIVHSVGPCSHWAIERDRASGRDMDEFPQYFDDYPKVAAWRHRADAGWLEPLRRRIHSFIDRADDLGMRSAMHFYEPMLPWIFEKEYPELVTILKRPTQGGIIDVHSHRDPDDPRTWELIKSKYRELARDFPKLGMMILTTWDGAGSLWCMAKAKMPIHERLAKMMIAAREGVREVRKDCQVVFRLWGRNWPSAFYREGHGLIQQSTGLKDADELMAPIGKAHNDSDVVIPKAIALLPKDIPLMYKSTRLDIYDNSPLTLAAGQYPKDRPQILEISYELYHRKPWPWCKIQHIRKGLDAVRTHKLAGYLAVPINMGNNDLSENPETGNLGRMNNWFFEQLMQKLTTPDRELLGAWLEKEFHAPAPKVVLDALLAADELADRGCANGFGIAARASFATLHDSKLYWNFDGFVDPEFPQKMANPTREWIEARIADKENALVEACNWHEKLVAAEAATPPALFQELRPAWETFRDYMLLRRDWNGYLMMQLALEHKLYPPSVEVLTRMSRYVEQFIVNLEKLKDTAAGKLARKQISFPNHF
ncbi:MAG: hypothetical protein ACREJ2_15420 [Planctomycetota bacterium]